MITTVESYINYLSDTKKKSINTRISYKNDLSKMVNYLQSQDIMEWKKVTSTSLNSYLLFLESKGMSGSTISRNIASMKSFFTYCTGRGIMEYNPALPLKTPKIERKSPMFLTEEEIEKLLTQPGTNSPKERRDSVMMELLYTTGIHVSGMMKLRCQDIDFERGILHNLEEDKEQIFLLSKNVEKNLKDYIMQARPYFLRHKSDQDPGYLFLNCNGGVMSRQGFWKNMKHYGVQAGIKKEITLHTLRHSHDSHKVLN